MLAWFFLGLSAYVMYQVAEMDGHRGGLWAFFTFAIGLACAILIPLPLLNIGIGLAVSFIVYFVYKLVTNG